MPLHAGQSLGQTFVARWGLNGIEIFLAPDEPGEGNLTLHLRDNSDSATDIATASFPLGRVVAPGFYLFTFAPREDSYKHNYYFHLEGMVAVRPTSAHHSVTHFSTALYIKAASPLTHKQHSVWRMIPSGMLGLVRQGMLWLGMIAVTVLLFVLPGLAF
jgi:hypothetical protein